MLKLLQWVSGLSALLFGALWLWRCSLAYNAQGAYLNETEGVVYYEQAVLVYGLLAIACLLCTAVFWVLARSRKPWGRGDESCVEERKGDQSSS